MSNSSSSNNINIKSNSNNNILGKNPIGKSKYNNKKISNLGNGSGGKKNPNFSRVTTEKLLINKLRIMLIELYNLRSLLVNVLVEWDDLSPDAILAILNLDFSSRMSFVFSNFNDSSLFGTQHSAFFSALSQLRVQNNRLQVEAFLSDTLSGVINTLEARLGTMDVNFDYRDVNEIEFSDTLNFFGLDPNLF